MARRRYISTAISVDKAINQLAVKGGDFAVMLYTWMIPHAGDDGRLTGDPDEILMTVIPGRRDKDSEDVAEALAAMVNCGLIEWDDQHVTFPPESFYRYQTYIKPENRRQAPEHSNRSDKPTSTATNSDEQRKTPQKAASVSPSFSPPVTPSPSVSPSEDSVSHETARKREPRPAPKPAEADRQNPIWDALVETSGKPATKNERSDFGETVSQLKDADATVVEIYAFPAWWYESFPGAKLTHRCYREHLGKFRSSPARPAQVSDIKNTMVRSALTADLSDITDELEAQHGSRRHLPAQNGRPGELFGDPRRLGTGERPPQPDVLPAPRRAGTG